MRISVSTYIYGTSPVHACDARAKIIVLIAYTIALFFVDTWLGMLAMVAALFVIVLLSRVGVRPFLPALTVTAVLMALTIVFNGFTIDIAASSLQAPAAGVPLAGESPVLPSAVLVGSFGITGAGMARGCFFALRILALVMGSLVVAYTTTSTALVDAFAGFLRPLRRLRVPVDDIATVLSIALRFIPVTFEELGRIHDAQVARCAPLDSGPLFARLRTWVAVFIPLFVRMFRRADALAVAMDARCYGASGVRRTSLSVRRFSGGAAFVVVAGLCFCVALAAFL